MSSAQIPLAGPQAFTPGRVLLAIGGVYIAQGLVSAIAFRGAPAIMRASGVPLDQIGLVSLLMIPWALKFAWAPAVERYRLPLGERTRSHLVILPGQILIVALLAIAAFIDPGRMPIATLAALAIVALTSATVDIACDGFAVEQLKNRLRGLGNSLQVGGSYVGYLIGGGLLLVLVHRGTWMTGMLAMAAIAAALTLPSLLVAKSAPTRAATTAHRPSLSYALGRREVRVGLLIVVIFQVGMRIGQAMISPFMIDRGFDLSALGMIYGVGSTVASLAGTLLAGLALRRAKPDHVLLACLTIQAVLLALLAALSAQSATGKDVLIVLVLLKNAAGAAGFVALYTQMMGWSSLKQAGVDFTLFQCADAAVAAVSGVAAGLIAQHLGYAACFALACGLSGFALLATPYLLRALRLGMSATARE